MASRAEDHIAHFERMAKQGLMCDCLACELIRELAKSKYQGKVWRT